MTSGQEIMQVEVFHWNNSKDLHVSWQSMVTIMAQNSESGVLKERILTRNYTGLLFDKPHECEVRGHKATEVMIMYIMNLLCHAQPN